MSHVTADAPRTRLVAEIGEGVRWLWRHRVLRAFCGMLGVWNFASNMTDGILVLWALEVLHLDARGFGFLGLGFAGGSLLGTFVAERFTRLLGEARRSTRASGCPLPPQSSPI